MEKDGFVCWLVGYALCVCCDSESTNKKRSEKGLGLLRKMIDRRNLIILDAWYCSIKRDHAQKNESRQHAFGVDYASAVGATEFLMVFPHDLSEGSVGQTQGH